MSEVDYENKIIHKWKNFEDFFKESINMLKNITEEWLNDTEIKKLDGFDRQLELWDRII